MQPRWRCIRCAKDLPPGDSGCACGWSLQKRKDYFASTSSAFVPDGFSEERRDHLRDLDERHFWFDAREKLLTRIFLRECRTTFPRALDLGCGTGRFLATLEKFGGELVVGVDGHDGLACVAAERATSATVVAADVENVPLASEQFDLITLLDVLEHVDPLSLLKEARRLAAPGAHLLISVPAHDWLWSSTDEAAGHRCRYDRAMLRAELEKTGWSPGGSTHYQALLLPLVLATRRVRSDRAIGVERRPPVWLNRFLGACNSFEVAALSRFSLPFGSSLVAWAWKDMP
ncbi:MAG: class I SAM-dependent methyltransferase [Candidatus Binatia bacterium]|nr:class I SAM-dependent methyltransferase [Candidatus Binatia bacterium]